MTTHDEEFDPFAFGELSTAVPLTPEQEEIWLSIELGGDSASAAYNQPSSLELEGELDTAALRRALDALAARHDALRSTLSGDGSTLCVTASGTIPLSMADLSGLELSVRDAELQRARTLTVTEAFDLVHGPVVRGHLLRLEPTRHVLLLVAHHVFCDGWSQGVLWRDLGRLYSAEQCGHRADLPAAPSFSDYASTRRASLSTVEARESLAYWLSRFEDLPPPLDLPLDAPRPPQRTFAADRFDWAIPAPLVVGLREVAAAHGANIVAVLLAAFQVFLHRLSGLRSVVVAVPVAGQLITGQPDLVGHCVRALPLRADIDPAQPFSDHLRRAHGALMDGLDHPHFTLGSLIKELAPPRDASRIPLAPVMFNVDQEVQSPVFDGLLVRTASIPRAYENFEVFVNAVVSEEGVLLETMYKTDLFERPTIERRLAEFTTLIDAIVRDPGQPVGKLDLLPGEERERLFDFNRASERAFATDTVCGLFRRRAAAHPQRIAVTGNGNSLSYGQLERSSAQLASQLREAGIGRGCLVGVCLSRSVGLLVGLFGVLRSGAAYVPLDPEYPTERLEFIATDAKLAAMVTDEVHAHRLPGAGLRLFQVDRLDQPFQSSADEEMDESAPSEPAYVIYTSGSTGQPKGVVVEHRNVANFLASMAAEPGICAEDVLVAVTTPSFDISVLELFLPLIVGARVVIATPDEIVSGTQLARLLSESCATVMQATPSGWRVLLEAGWEGKHDLVALVGGEALSPDLAGELGQKTASLWNCYGPTETTVWSTLDRIGDGPITIGRPIANTSTYVLDGNLQLVPFGVIGELFIGGRGVARGYLDRPTLTSGRFLPDPFADDSAARIYRTGDLARVRWDGRLEWLGRSDFQVKVRGHRIELGEIEARLLELAGVREAVVVAREDRPGDQRIVGYVRLELQRAFDEQAVRERLRGSLPPYMLPQHIVSLPSLPLTPNGKIDRRALPAPQLVVATESHAPETQTQTRVADAMASLLGVARVGRDDDFFLLGGHSLLALRLVQKVRSDFGIELELGAVFAGSSVKQLAEIIDAAVAARRVARSPDQPDGNTEMEEFLL